MRIHKTLLAFTCAMVLGSCHFYKVDRSINHGHDVGGAVYKGKSIIVHTPEQVFLLSYPKLVEGNTLLAGVPRELGPYHQFYKNTKRQSANKFNPNDGDPENEVHVYTTEMAMSDSSDLIFVPIESIKRMDVFKEQKGLNTVVTTGVVIGSIYGFLIFIALIGEFLF